MKQIFAFLLLVAFLIALLAFSGFAVKEYPVALTGIAATIGFFFRWMFDSIKESKARLHEKKRQVYSNLLKPYMGVLINTIKGNQGDGQDTLSPEVVGQAIEAAFDTILYGSDAVILGYGEFRNMNIQDPIYLTPLWYRFASLLLAMRKDLGHTFTTVDEVDLLAMVFNMDASMRKLNKEALIAVKKKKINLDEYKTDQSLVKR